MVQKKLSRLKLDIFVGFIMKLYDVAEILILLLDTVKHIKKLLYYHFINSLLGTYYIPKFWVFPQLMSHKIFCWKLAKNVLLRIQTVHKGEGGVKKAKNLTTFFGGIQKLCGRGKGFTKYYDISLLSKIANRGKGVKNVQNSVHMVYEWPHEVLNTISSMPLNFWCGKNQDFDIFFSLNLK